MLGSPGRIKIYGCESASAAWWPGSQSFAKPFFDLFARTHRGIAVYGYTHSIASWYETGADGKRHKFIDGVRSRTSSASSRTRPVRL
jgi:hypothetical protein